MLHRTIIALATVVSLVNATCNPLTTGNCPADPALAASFKEDFTSESKHFLVVNSKGVSFTDDGLELTIAERFDNPSLKSNFYIMFGKVEVVLQAAPGQGIISSFYLQSDDLDEIDIELFGTDTTQFQSNFFAKGYTGNYDRGQYIATSSSPVSNFHTYTLEWTESALTWSLDGNVVRTLESTDAKGFPQLPMYIMMGSWAGGDPSNPPGTIEWAGGATDYSKAPFSMYIKSVIVADYSTGSEYSYGDNTGSWQSIKVKDGSVNGRQEQANQDFTALQGGQIISAAQPQSSTTGSATTSSSSVVTSTSPVSSATSVTSGTPARTLTDYSSSSITTTTSPSSSTTYTSSAELTSQESFVSTSTSLVTTQKSLVRSSSTESPLPPHSASGSSTLTTSLVSSATSSPTVAFASINGAQANQILRFSFIFALCAFHFF